MRLALLLLAVVACGSPTNPMPSFEETAGNVVIHVATFDAFAQEPFTTKQHHESYIEVDAYATLHDAAGQPLALGSGLVPDLECWFTKDGFSFAAPALGSPAACGFGGYVELPRGKKPVSMTVSLDSLVGIGYTYDSTANEVSTSEALVLR